MIAAASTASPIYAHIKAGHLRIQSTYTEARDLLASACLDYGGRPFNPPPVADSGERPAALQCHAAGQARIA